MAHRKPRGFREDLQADVQLRLHTTDGVQSSTTYVTSGAQSILRDVVAQIGASGSAAQEVTSNRPIRVWSRIYNLVASNSSCYPNGTFGQNYPALLPDQGLRTGESGPGARLMDGNWVTDIPEHCVSAGCAFFLKQWGGTNKKKTGRTLEGHTWDTMPA